MHGPPAGASFSPSALERPSRHEVIARPELPENVRREYMQRLPDVQAARRMNKLHSASRRAGERVGPAGRARGNSRTQAARPPKRAAAPARCRRRCVDMARGRRGCDEDAAQAVSATAACEPQRRHMQLQGSGSAPRRRLPLSGPGPSRSREAHAATRESRAWPLSSPGGCEASPSRRSSDKASERELRRRLHCAQHPRSHQQGP